MEGDTALSHLWKSLMQVEQCFEREMLPQPQGPKSFVEECMTARKTAYLSFKTAENNAHRSIRAAEPFLSREVVALAESAVYTAAKEFNSLINLSRRVMALPDREKARRVMLSKRRRSLELFRRHVRSLRQGIPETIE